MTLNFKKATIDNLDTILSWLDSPHVQEFWDNSQAHRDDLIFFVEGKQNKRTYFDGVFDYWVGFQEDEPFAFLLTSIVTKAQEMNDLWQRHLSNTGHTYTLDFCIGNKEYLGKGYAAPTLHTFTQFLKKDIDPLADTFFIDPNENNPRAQHVYTKAGFNSVGSYAMEGGFFDGEKTFLMVKRL